VALSITQEVAHLKRLTVDQLRQRYAEVFGDRTGARHKDWLVKRIAWRLQALAEGGLSERARQRASELAREADLRLSPPKSTTTPTSLEGHQVAIAQRAIGDRRLPVPGTMITRPYKGETLQVRVLADGFEYEGEKFGSLSSVAKRITGSHCNGYLFFRLGQQRAVR
jgi:Protein of unknown function (DUF2924)